MLSNADLLRSASARRLTQALSVNAFSVTYYERPETEKLSRPT